MCTLTFCEPGFTPKKKELAASCKANPDGFGFAIVTDSGIIVGKDMDAGKVMKQFYKERFLHQDGPALFHARIGTHGEKGVTNCHPFWVDEDEGLTVVAHNGVMRVQTMLKKEDEKRSDTGIFAQDYLSKIGVENLDHPQIFNMVEDWMGRGNKVVVLTIDPKAQYQYYILNEDTGHWVKNKDNEPMIWWSNRNYEVRKPYVQPSRTGLYAYTDPHEGMGWLNGNWVPNEDFENHVGECWVATTGWVKREECTTWQVQSFDRAKATALEKKARKEAAEEARAKTSKSGGTLDLSTIRFDPTESPQTTTFLTNGGRTSCKFYRKSLGDGVYRWFDTYGKCLGSILDRKADEVTTSIKDDDEDEDDETCPTCGVEIEKFNTGVGYCSNCSTCLTCEEFAEWCQCQSSVVDEAMDVLAEMEAIHDSIIDEDTEEKQEERRKFLHGLIRKYGIGGDDRPQLMVGEAE